MDQVNIETQNRLDMLSAEGIARAVAYVSEALVIRLQRMSALRI